MIFIADLIACSTCFGDHYAHHQELESIIQKVAACGIWCFGFQVVSMVLSWGLCVRFAGCCFKAPNTTGCNLLYNTLELLMMGIMVPETCWAGNKIWNKNHLLHLAGILFPHINNDARSKSLQIYSWLTTTEERNFLVRWPSPQPFLKSLICQWDKNNCPPLP